MRPRALVLVDGEHYPPVVRAAIERAGERDDVVAALLLGGREKLDGTPDYGVPLERAGDDAAASMVAAAQRHGASCVLDLSDEPVLGPAARLRLASHALAAGLAYGGPDFDFRPPPQEPAGLPALAVVGTGKRIGKTAVAGQAARVLARRYPGRGGAPGVVVVAMGRGGPARPQLADGRDGRLGIADLLARARAGEHAASDYLEDAVLAGVVSVGCRRCGGGLAGATYLSNVGEGVELACRQRPRLLLLEGSGASLPPVAADRTVLVCSAATEPRELGGALGPYRLLRSHLVVLTMCEPPLAPPGRVEELRAVIERIAPGLPVVATVLRPRPAAAVRGRRLAVFTTAPAAVHDAVRATLEAEHGAQVVALSGALADRPRLRRDLEAPGVRAADAYLVEIKAAAIDVVAAAAAERGVELVFCDNRPQELAGERGLDAELLRLAGEAVGDA